MFDELMFKEQLTLLPVPTDIAQVRFDPPNASFYNERMGHPSMYLLNAPLNSYFYCTEMMAFLSLDLNEEVSYNFSMWFEKSKRFAVSLVNVSELYSEDTVNLRDTIRFGNFHETEEEHFQNECLNGTPLSWEMENILQTKLNDLTKFYQDVYYTVFLNGGKEC